MNNNKNGILYLLDVVVGNSLQTTRTTHESNNKTWVVANGIVLLWDANRFLVPLWIDPNIASWSCCSAGTDIELCRQRVTGVPSFCVFS